MKYTEELNELRSTEFWENGKENKIREKFPIKEKNTDKKMYRRSEAKKNHKCFLMGNWQ